jgi:multiple sugar transport system permease protein
MKSRLGQDRLLRGENIAGFFFLLPGLIGFLTFVLFPLVFSFLLGFTQWSFISGFNEIKFLGLSNFWQLITDFEFQQALQNTVLYTIGTVPVTIVLGFLIAVVLHRYVYAKNALKIAIFMPYISSLVAISVVWKILLFPAYGPVNEFLSWIGIAHPPGWFGDAKWALTALMIQTVWLQLGYNVIVYMAGLATVNLDLYDAASIDGAGAVRQLIHVTLPGVAATTFFLSIMGFIGSFKVFDQISVITQGGPGYSTEVIAYYIYQQAFQFYHMGYASAMAWILFLIIFILTAIQWRYGNTETA